MKIVVVEEAEDLTGYAAAWEDLAAAAVEPNVFYEPWMLLPAIEAFGRGRELRFVLIFAPDAARPQGPPLLCGFFPLERRRRYKGLPVGVLSLWQHLHCFLCTPLIRAGYGPACLGAFLDWLARDPRGGPLIELGLVSGEGPFHQLLVSTLYERAVLSFVDASYTRAFFRPRVDAEAYLRAALSGGARKELRRQEKRLAEVGRLDCAVLAPGESAEGWLRQFLRLESSGWKGRHGTAFASDGAEERFFMSVATAAHRRGRLDLLTYRLDGCPVAQKCSFRAGEGSFAFKIAFDEQYARFSPGVHLEIENIRRLHGTSAPAWMDSCAVWDNRMINRLWLDRKTIQTVLISTGRRRGDAFVTLAPVLRWLKRLRPRRGRCSTQ